MKKIVYSFLFVSISILIIFMLFGSFESFSSSLLKAYSEEPSKFIGFSFLILASDVVMPVPSSIVMYLNGYTLGIIEGSSLSWISLMTSSILAYGIGRYNPWNYVSDKDKIPANKMGPYLIIVSRGIPVLAETISITGGLIKMSFKKFLIYHAIGYIPLCLLYGYLGKYAIESDRFVLALALSIGLTILFWLAGYLLDYYRNAQS